MFIRVKTFFYQNGATDTNVLYTSLAITIFVLNKALFIDIDFGFCFCINRTRNHKEKQKQQRIEWESGFISNFA